MNDASHSDPEAWRRFRDRQPIVPATPDGYEARPEPAEQPEQPEAVATERARRAGATASGGGIDPAAEDHGDPFKTVEGARRYFNSRRNGPPIVNAIRQR